MSTNKKELSCLYTKQKTQKRKVWKDGRLVLFSSSCRICLHDANPPPGASNSSLDEIEVTKSQMDSIMSMEQKSLETERFLVSVEGPWNAPNNSTLLPKQVGLSKGMKKVLSSKFRKPKSYVPPRPDERRRKRDEENVLSQRKRPLQPGELERKFYGHANDSNFNTTQRPPIYNGLDSRIFNNGSDGNRNTNTNQRLPLQSMGPEEIIHANVKNHNGHATQQDAQQFQEYEQPKNTKAHNKRAFSFVQPEGFDPSDYYGEEEDDEGESDCEEEEIVQQFHDDVPKNQYEMYTEEYETSTLHNNANWGVDRDTAPTIDKNKTNVENVPLSASNIEAAKDDVLSKNDLLQMFGGTASDMQHIKNPIQSTAGEYLKDGCSNNLSYCSNLQYEKTSVDSGAKKSFIDGLLQTEAIVDEHANCSDMPFANHDNDQTTLDSDDNHHFTLPLPSESSDSDEED